MHFLQGINEVSFIHPSIHSSWIMQSNHRSFTYPFYNSIKLTLMKIFHCLSVCVKVVRCALLHKGCCHKLIVGTFNLVFWVDARSKPLSDASEISLVSYTTSCFVEGSIVIGIRVRLLKRKSLQTKSQYSFLPLQLYDMGLSSVFNVYYLDSFSKCLLLYVFLAVS